MANHLLRQIRDAVKTALTGLSLNAVTIQPFVNRSDDQALQDSELPAFRIRVRTSSAAIESIGVNRVYDRVADIEVDGCVKKNATFEDDVYELVRLAEVALINSAVTAAKRIDIKSIEIVDDAQGEKPVCIAKMTFEVEFYSVAGVPDVAL